MKKITRVIAGSLALVLAMSASACTGKKNKNTSDVPTVTWYMSGLAEGADKDAVFEKANELLEERYGLRIEFNMIDSGNYSQKMQMINASRQEYDLAFTSNWSNDYVTNVSNNALMDITDLLPEYAPNLYASMNADTWKAATVNGRIYAVPNWQIQAKAAGVNMPKEKLDKTGMSIDDINTLEDIEEYLKKIHELEPETNLISDFWTYLAYYYGIAPILNEKLPAAIRFDTDDDVKVFNQYATDEFMEYAKMRYRWVQEGLAVNDYDPERDGGKLGRCPFGIFVYKPGDDVNLEARYNTPYYVKPISKALLSSHGVCATMTGVSATCKQPEIALKALEAVNTDSEIYRLLTWGIEGEHYTKVSDTQADKVENSKFTGMTDWALGSVMNSFVYSNADPDTAMQTKQFNDEAVASPLLGVNIDTVDITTEMANCITVVNEQLKFIELGLAGEPEAAVNKMNDALKAAGIDTVIEHIQKQIDEQLK